MIWKALGCAFLTRISFGNVNKLAASTMLDIQNSVCSNAAVKEEFNGKDTAKGIHALDLQASGSVNGNNEKKLDPVSSPLPLSSLPAEWESLGLEKQKKIRNMLTWDNLMRWDFDVLELSKLTDNNPLLFIGWSLLASPHAEQAMAYAIGEDVDDTVHKVQGYNFVDKYNIKVENLIEFLRSIEADYNETPYHNNAHAADVTQSIHSIIQMGSKKYLDDIYELSLILSAIGHDVHHPGRNNLFQVKAKTPIAALYKEQSVLENLHASSMHERLVSKNHTKQSDILSALSPTELEIVDETMQHAILYTDMSKHSEIVGKMKEIIENPKYADGNFADLTTEDLKTFTAFLLHVSDISNPAKPAPYFIHWTDRLYDEFFLQGDEEKAMNLPISPMCDREHTKRVPGQIGFIEFVILPTYQIVSKFSETAATVVLPVITDNLKYWKNQKEPNPVVRRL